MCQTYGCDNRSDGTGEEHGYCDPCATARRSERTLRAEIARLRAALEDIADITTQRFGDLVKVNQRVKLALEGAR